MTRNLFLGCIADDFTGATDLANNLVKAGMRVVQLNGLPDEPMSLDADAVVIALKSRTISAKLAVAQSLEALKWLQLQGAQQIYFKVCSTFDSTAQGNIGPVTEALMHALQTDFCIATPAFPDNGRTVFKGHLFVGDVLLNESGMQHHPLTPMTDSNLVRVMQSQCTQSVGLVDYRHVMAGESQIRAEFARQRSLGHKIVIVDALSNDDLMRLGKVLGDMPLFVGGSGVAIGLPQNIGIQASLQASELPKPLGHQAIVSGSCSIATNAQVKHFITAGYPAFAIDPYRIAQGIDVVQEALAWAQPLLQKTPVLVYSTAQAGVLKSVQNQLGAQAAGHMLEQTLAKIACGLVQIGVGQLILAGGETSGACVQALNVRQMQIGMQIDAGVPWCYALSNASSRTGLHLTLKSGNFGTEDFFSKAFKLLS